MSGTGDKTFYLERRKKHTAGDKTRANLKRLNGTTEVVPFPFVEKFELFRSG
jgi:hypothetical protein